MYRSAKEQLVTRPEQQLAMGGIGEAISLQSSEWYPGEMNSLFTSTSEGLKQAPRKTFR
jgi:hypothetical protein